MGKSTQAVSWAVLGPAVVFEVPQVFTCCHSVTTCSPSSFSVPACPCQRRSFHTCVPGFFTPFSCRRYVALGVYSTLYFGPMVVGYFVYSEVSSFLCARDSAPLR
jgi:hypothetical protein